MNAAGAPAIAFNMPQFLLQVFLAALTLAGANVLIARSAKNSMPRQVIQSIDANADATVLAAGNSLMATAFDAALFQESLGTDARGVKPLNIALGSSGTVEHLLLLRHALAKDFSVKMLIYGFFDLQMTERPVGGWGDLVGNRAMAYYVEPYFAAKMYAPDSRLQLFRSALIGHMPMLVERLTIWARVEKLRRWIGELGLPHQKASAFGRAEDFKAIEFGDAQGFADKCRQSVDQQLPLTPSVQGMLDAAKAHGIAFVAVEMPMTSLHRQRYYASPAWLAYQARLRKLIVNQGGTFIDASQWLEESGFFDVLHAGPSGRTEFTQRLARELRSMIVPH